VLKRTSHSGLAALTEWRPRVPGVLSIDRTIHAPALSLVFPSHGGRAVRARERLRREGIDPTELLIVIHPGAGAAVKLWRSSAWMSCGTHISRSMADCTPVHFILTGTAAEQPLLEEIAQATTARTTVLAGMTIGQLAAVFQQVELVLGVDSGPLHLAVALGIPTMRIYGPIDPRIFGPWGSQEQHTVVVSTHRCPSCAAIPLRPPVFSRTRTEVASLCQARARTAGARRRCPASSHSS